MNDDYLIEFTTSLLAQQRFALEQEDLGFNTRMDVRHALEDLKRADMYFMGNEFTDILDEYHTESVMGRWKEETGIDNYGFLEYDTIRFDAETRPPSNLVFVVLHCLNGFSTENKTGLPDHRRGFLCRQSENGEVDVRVLSEFAYPDTIGSFTPNGKIRFSAEMKLHEPSDAGQDMVYLGGAFSLINQPRFVKREAAGTRQQRKAARRSQEIAVEAWHRISWDIDKPVHAAERGDRSFHMPYHYTRGHFRKAQPHYKNAEFVYDGWHQWIDGFWSGHPAYGTKKGAHFPTTTRLQGRSNHNNDFGLKENLNRLALPN